MRRAAAVLLAGLLVALVGCGSKSDKESAAAPPPPATTPAPPAAPPGTPADDKPAKPPGNGKDDTPPAGLPGFPGTRPGAPAFPPPGGSGAVPGFPGFPSAPPPGPGGPTNPFPPPTPPGTGNPFPPVAGNPGGAGTPQPPLPGKDPPGQDPMAKAPAPPPKKEEWKWPLSVNGWSIDECIKETNDPDPSVRKFALQSLPQFGPVARRKDALKAVFARMDRERERDPGVRATAFDTVMALAMMGEKEIGFDSANDTQEAIRLMYITVDQSAGPTRLHAMQALAAFGSKAEAAVSFLTTQNVSGDFAFENRLALATTLGAVGYDERTGPNAKALQCLSHVLLKDNSAPVRLAAAQSLVALGPPLEPRAKDAPLLKDVKDPKDAPKPDEKAAAAHVAAIKERLKPGAKPKDSEREPTGLVERDRQVEIYLRMALMVFDRKEVNDENLGRLVKYLDSGDQNVRIQALAAFAQIGPLAARNINDIVKVLKTDDLIVTSAAVNALGAMGEAGKPAVEPLERLGRELEKLRDQRYAEKTADEEFRKALASLNLKPDEVKPFLEKLRESMPEEQLRRQVAETVKYLKNPKAAAAAAAPPPAEKNPPEKKQ